MAYTPEQLAHYREQIRRSKELMANGMSPEEAEMEAAKQMIADRRQAAEEQRISAGNGADIDNLAGAATPLAVEPTVGRLAPAQEDRVFADDPTGGNARILAARAAADAERAAWYNSPEGPGGSAAADTERWYQTFGDARTPETRANMSDTQSLARQMQQAKEQRLRNLPAYVGLEAKRLADRTGRPEREILGELGPIDMSAMGPDEQAVALQQRDAARRVLQAEARDLQRAKLAERQQRAEALRMLQSNPLGYIGRDDITEAQRDIAMANMPGGQFVADPRVRVAKVAAQAEADKAAAERDLRIAAEARAQTRAEEAAAAARDFDAEQKRLDRELRREEGGASREETADARKMEADDRTRQFAQTMEQMKLAEAQNARRHEAMMAENKLAAEQSKRQFEAKYGLDEKKLEEAERLRDEAIERAKRQQLLDSMESKYGEGVIALAEGDYETPDAQAALAKMAADADQSWTGFYNSDARRMDAVLARLGVADPAVRRDLVSRFGLSSMTATGAGGRSGLVSGVTNWLYGDY